MQCCYVSLLYQGFLDFSFYQVLAVMIFFSAFLSPPIDLLLHNSGVYILQNKYSISFILCCIF